MKQQIEFEAEQGPQLAAGILMAHADVERHGRAALDAARRAGDLLMRAKAGLRHGEWLPWLTANVPGLAARTAQTYMRIAERWRELPNTQGAAPLTITQALAVLASPRGGAAVADEAPDEMTDVAVLGARDQGWRPPAGCGAVVPATSRGAPVTVELWPSTTDGFWYVNVHGGEAGLDGGMRPLAGWALAWALRRHFHLEGVDLPGAMWLPREPWVRNETWAQIDRAIPSGGRAS